MAKLIIEFQTLLHMLQGPNNARVKHFFCHGRLGEKDLAPAWRLSAETCHSLTTSGHLSAEHHSASKAPLACAKGGAA